MCLLGPALVLPLFPHPCSGTCPSSKSVGSPRWLQVKILSLTVPRQVGFLVKRFCFQWEEPYLLHWGTSFHARLSRRGSTPPPGSSLAGYPRLELDSSPVYMPVECSQREEQASNSTRPSCGMPVPAMASPWSLCPSGR